MNGRPLILAAGLALALGSPGLHGQSTDRNVSSAQTSGFGFGARALGMAGAFIAIADDASAISWNPGGLGQLLQRQLTFSGSLNRYSTKTTSDELRIDLPGGGLIRRVQDDTELLSQDGGVDFVSFVQPVSIREHPLVLQLSYTRQARSGSSSQGVFARISNDLGPPHDQLERPASLEEVQFESSGSGGVDVFTLGVGTSFRGKLFLGFSFGYFRGATASVSKVRVRATSLRDASGMPESRLVSDYLVTETSELLIRGFNINVGVLYKPTHWLSAGAVFRSGWSSDETLHYGYRNRGHSETLYPDGRVYDVSLSSNENSRLTYPDSVGLGIAVRPFPPLTFSADVTWTGWSKGKLTHIPVVEKVCAPAGCGPNPFSIEYGDAAFPSESLLEAGQQEDQVAVRLGAEYVFRAGRLLIPVRAGAYALPAIAPLFADRISSPGEREFDANPRTDFKGLTAGIGIVFPIGKDDRLLLDIAGVVEEAASSWQSLQPLLDGDGNTIGTVSQTSDRSVRNKRLIGSVIFYF